MEYLKGLLTNRISIVIVLVHWILFLLFFWNILINIIDPVKPSGFYHPTFWDALISPIIVMDLPAVLIAVLIWSPYYFIDMPDIFKNGAIATSFFTITIQWLIIGKLFSRVIERKKQKVIEVSIFDAN